jgi:hypothetical protein
MPSAGINRSRRIASPRAFEEIRRRIAPSIDRLRANMNIPAWIVAALWVAGLWGDAMAQSGTPIRAKDVVKEYDADKAAAIAKYGDKPIRLVGEIGRINLDQWGVDNMILDGDNIFDGLAVWLDVGQSARTVAVGQTVTLACVMGKEEMRGELCRFQR